MDGYSGETDIGVIGITAGQLPSAPDDTPARYFPASAREIWSKLTPSSGTDARH